MRLVILLSLGISVSFGGAPVRTPVSLRSGGVNQAQVEKWTKVWQKRLALEDWDIAVQIVRSWELRPETLGNLRWNSGAKTATIRVLDPADYDLPAAEIPTDIEYTVVHELIHLQLAALPRDSASKNIEEKVVNRISEALFALDKGSGYRPRAAVPHVLTKERSSAEASRSTHP